VESFRIFVAVGAVARLAALLSFLAAGPDAGSGRISTGTFAVLALYAASGVALLAAAGRGRSVRRDASTLVKGVVAVLLALVVALAGAIDALGYVLQAGRGLAPFPPPPQAAPEALLATFALVDLVATGLGVRRLGWPSSEAREQAG
jgi:hypothetical protein